jgi:hypothetical protein
LNLQPLEGDPKTPLVAKAIRDLDEIASLLKLGLSGATTWQRQLAVQLGNLTGCVQVLRLTIAMERGDEEILSAAKMVLDSGLQSKRCIMGTRVDAFTKASLGLACELAQRICKMLSEVSSPTHDEGA